MTKSAMPTNMKGAHGPTLSNSYPPTTTKTVVPKDPKKKAIPERVPLTVLFMFLINSASTERNYNMEEMTSRMHSVYPQKLTGFSINRKLVATTPLKANENGIVTRQSALSAI